MAKGENNIDKKAFRAGAWYTVSIVATKAILVLTTPIFTRIMTQQDYGITATFTSWYTLLLTFCSLNLTYSIGRAKLDYTERLDQYVGCMQVLSLIMSLIFAVTGTIFCSQLSNLLDLPKNIVLILAVYLVFAPTIALYQAKFKYQYRYKENIFISLYTTVVSVLCSIGLLFVFPEERYLGRIIGIVFPTILLSIALWWNAFRKHNVVANWEFTKYGLLISLPLVLNSVSLSILVQSDRVVITKVCGTESTAVYTIAYQLSILVSLILDSIGQAWLPWFHDSYKKRDFIKIRKNLNPLILLGCYLGIGCIAVAPEAMWILGGEDYLSGKWVVAPIVLGLVCKFIYGNYEHIELHLKKTTYIGMGTVIAATLNIILNVIFIPKYGFIAAGYTTFFSYFVLMIIHYIITKYILYVDIYDHRVMYLAIIIESALAVVLILNYENWLIRYGILVAVTIIIVTMNWKRLCNILYKSS